MLTLTQKIIQHHSQKDFWIIYKHSHTCLTSQKAYKQIQILQEQFPSLPIIQLEVHEERGVSDRIAEYFEIPHESPQCILFKWKKILQVMNHFWVTSRQITHHLKWWWNGNS
jgi:bacillithiol system protein YtxJ